MPEIRTDRGNTYWGLLAETLKEKGFNLTDKFTGFCGWSATLDHGEEKIGTIAYNCVERSVIVRIDNKEDSRPQEKGVLPVATVLVKLLERFEVESGLRIIVVNVG